MSDIFLDTNVLVYAIDKRAPEKRERARRLLQELRQRGRVVVSTQVIQEFFAAATRKLQIPPSRVQRLARWFWPLPHISVTWEIIDSAMGLAVDHQMSFWDALILATARHAGCRQVWTEDSQSAAEIAGVRIHNPFA